MNDWDTVQGRETAFELAIGPAVTDENLAKPLLDPTTAKTTLEARGDIKLPEKMTVVFYRQENLDNHLVAVIPARDPDSLHLPHIKPGFKSCFLCTWITYLRAMEEQRELYQIGREKDLKKL